MCFLQCEQDADHHCSHSMYEAFLVGFLFFYGNIFLSHILLNQPKTYLINLILKKILMKDIILVVFIIINKNNNIKNIQFINLFITINECIYILKVDLFYYVY